MSEKFNHVIEHTFDREVSEGSDDTHLRARIEGDFVQLRFLDFDSENWKSSWLSKDDIKALRQLLTRVLSVMGQ